MNFTFLNFDSLNSTNTEALKEARLGAEEGLCIVARQQTAGRGRLGRSWISEKDAGLYFSIVLRPKIETRFLTLITLMTGVAVHDLLIELGLKPDIKWVNDLLVNEKKICGILAETTETDTGLAVVVGIGINLRSTNFPSNIADTATSINDESSHTFTFEALSESLTKYLGYFYDMLCSENGPARIIDEWRRRSSYFSGKPVRVVLENGAVSGVTDGLEENGALRLRKENGTITIIQAGDVQSVRTSPSGDIEFSAEAV